MEIGNQNHRRRGKSVLSMVLLWEEEISDYEKIKYYRYRNLRLMEKMNILEGDWRGKCDCEIFCFFFERGGGREKEEREDN